MKDTIEGWHRSDSESDLQIVHVLPINDLREHIEHGASCWCNPSEDREKEDCLIIIHNSMDGREILEDIDLKKKDIPNHLALVAKHWLMLSDTDDLNVAIALRWLQKRHKYLTLTLESNKASTQAMVDYFDTFLRSLIEGD